MNSTDTGLALDKAYISTSIRDKAGPQLMTALKKTRPHGVKEYEVIETLAFDLKNCQCILHGALEKWDESQATHLIKV